MRIIALIGHPVRLVKDDSTNPGSITDYDGNVYNTVKIGTQVWIVENWKCTHLNDGTPLTKVTDNTIWTNASSGDLYYCAYDNNECYI